MNSEKNRGPNSLLLASTSVNFTTDLTASISTPKQFHLCPGSHVQPELLHDLGPGPPLPSQTTDRETKIPTSLPADCRGLRVQAGSADGGEGRAACRRNRSSETPRKKARGGENKARDYLRASADTPPPPGSRNGCTPPRILVPAQPPRDPSLTRSWVTAPYYR